MSSPRERITERVTRNGHPDNKGTPVPLLSLSEFFDGNDVDGSIGCNLHPMPTPAEFREVLEDLLKRPGVVDVRVQISMFDDPDWPFSDTVWVMTTTSVERVLAWLPDRFQPDEVWDGWVPDIVYEPYELLAGVRALGLWYD